MEKNGVRTEIDRALGVLTDMNASDEEQFDATQELVRIRENNPSEFDRDVRSRSDEAREIIVDAIRVLMGAQHEEELEEADDAVADAPGEDLLVLATFAPDKQAAIEDQCSYAFPFLRGDPDDEERQKAEQFLRRMRKRNAPEFFRALGALRAEDKALAIKALGLDA